MQGQLQILGMSKTSHELNDKAKETLSQLEGLALWEAETVLDLAKQELRHNAIVKISPLADLWLPSNPNKEEQPQT